MAKEWHGGKGDRRRTGADDRLYRSNFDRIFHNDGKVSNGKSKKRQQQQDE